MQLAPRQDEADINVSMSKALLDRIALKQTSFLKEATIGDIDIEGGRFKLLKLLGSLEKPESQFNMVTP